MGFSFKKATRSVGKKLTKAVKTVKQLPKNPKKAISSLSKQVANNGIDMLTLGNKKIVDSYTGGLATTAVNAAGGNTKDAARLGMTGASAYFGGPLAAFATNNALSQGDTAGGIYSTLGSSQGGDVELFKQVNDFLGSNNPLSNLANKTITGAFAKKLPKPAVIEARAVPVAAPAPKDNTMKYAMIGGGVLLVGLFAILATRK